MRAVLLRGACLAGLLVQGCGSPGLPRAPVLTAGGWLEDAPPGWDPAARPLLDAALARRPGARRLLLLETGVEGPWRAGLWMVTWEAGRAWLTCVRAGQGEAGPGAPAERLLDPEEQARVEAMAASLTRPEPVLGRPPGRGAGLVLVVTDVEGIRRRAWVRAPFAPGRPGTRPVREALELLEQLTASEAP